MGFIVVVLHALLVFLGRFRIDLDVLVFYNGIGTEHVKGQGLTGSEAEPLEDIGEEAWLFDIDGMRNMACGCSCGWFVGGFGDRRRTFRDSSGTRHVLLICKIFTRLALGIFEVEETNRNEYGCSDCSAKCCKWTTGQTCRDHENHGFPRGSW